MPTTFAGAKINITKRRVVLNTAASRGEQILAALRDQFGGHAEKAVTTKADS